MGGNNSPNKAPGPFPASVTSGLKFPGKIPKIPKPVIEGTKVLIKLIKKNPGQAAESGKVFCDREAVENGGPF